MDPINTQPSDELVAALNDLKGAYRQALDMQLWNQVPLLKRQLLEVKEKLDEAVGVLDQAESVKKHILKSEETLQKKENIFEQAKAKFLKFVEQMTREAEDEE